MVILLPSRWSILFSISFLEYLSFLWKVGLYFSMFFTIYCILLSRFHRTSDVWLMLIDLKHDGFIETFNIIIIDHDSSINSSLDN